ncbi:hypothetical protein MC885_000167 [Smutsia gigantea]|nr:hypothetical protein MC885_000167 [Smutsia gigantea]
MQPVLAASLVCSPCSWQARPCTAGLLRAPGGGRHLLPPFIRASDVICPTNISHYEFQVETGRFDNLTSVHLAHHTPTGTLVTIKITDLENCTEECLKASQRAEILSHFF